MVDGTEPVSVDNLASLVKNGAFGGIETLYSGESSDVDLPKDPKEFSALFVVVQIKATHNDTYVNKVLPVTPDKGRQWDDNEGTSLTLTDNRITTSNSARLIRGVYGIRAGGGSVLADLLVAALEGVA